MTQPTEAALPAFLIAYSDSSFTNPHDVVRPDEPKDRRGDFTHMGAKYWGLETARHRATEVLAAEQALVYDHNAHHWFQVGLQRRALVERITLSTRWYTGNQVRAVSVRLTDRLSGAGVEVLTREPLAPDREHEFVITATPATECEVFCFSEGGIARINLFGSITAQQPAHWANLLENARISHISNAHFGTPAAAVRGRRTQQHMVGWESARTGFGERALFHLRKPARVAEIIVDTYLHRLNAPLTCHVYGAAVTDEEQIPALMTAAPRWKLVFDCGHEVVPEDFQIYMLAQDYLREPVSECERFQIKLHLEKGSLWQSLLPFAPLRPDTFHRFDQLRVNDAVTHILYMHYPNGGIHGLQVGGVEQD
ncbi:hypothetical protein FKG94_01345 [Exilibacterium tricleocarpae]|uniref:Allantoicase domain-containing protein n=1 Tax=Exilibacterium tricleocarpae TaxID=2591008 RepID=A0A545U9S3_9GAMM|nr:hypothetical protein [Exilibacterium tricleocarpae]TQV86225.1 hypothetical protein FKG94_01345 [Exilibacterium tricleocarpae]